MMSPVVLLMELKTEAATRMAEVPLRFQAWEGRTGANRAEDWSARPSPEGIHQCSERFVAGKELGWTAVAKQVVRQGDEEGWFSGLV